MTLAESYAQCTALARSHYENFPVGRLVPASIRPHVHAVYAFARTADDIADEGYDDPRVQNRPATAPSPEQRLEQMTYFRGQLDLALQGKETDPRFAWIFLALGHTLKEMNLPSSLFYDLLSAFSQDIVKRRYADFPEVLDYCRRSANPVGRLVLYLHGYREEALHLLSDHICTGLQLANFWQDVSVDLGKDRIYLPRDSRDRFGVSEDQLFAGHCNDAFRQLLRFEVDRAQEIFDQGAPLTRHLHGLLRWEIRLTWLGGTTILEKIRRQDYDTLTRRPKIPKWEMLALAPRALFS
ncbi:MAG: squalene synthase HpnC [Candidatus Methylacidiphilales bacterium]|nr:squalene synthase HpnC [Candidatus Methylacidiphilales bacterium]